MVAPLSGIRVIDAGVFGVGPVAASFLGVLGADVVRIEPPYGDGMMYFGTPIGGVGSSYIGAQFNKKSITLDLATDWGKKTALKLTEQADVFIENRRPGAMDRMGLGFDVVSKVNPRIIYVSSPAFGTKGPLREYRGADNYVQGWTGFASLNGRENGPAEILRYTGHLDQTASAIVCQAVLLGLLVRDVIGDGQRIETSSFEAGIALQATRIAEFFATGEEPKRLGSASSTIVPSQAFRTLDNKYINVSVPREEFWPKLCKALELEDLQADSRFESNSQRVKHREELISILQSKFSELPAEWWLLHLQRNDVPCGLNFTCYDVIRDPHIQHNQFIVDVETPWGRMKMPSAPWKFSETPTLALKPPPFPDSNRAEILQMISYVHKPTLIYVDKKAVADEATRLPLQGVKVLDLTEEIAGPYCTMQLGDAGADVIKVENPAGDCLRNIAPFLNGESALFLALNRNKKSIVVDLETDTGRETIRKLAQDADILVESFSPGLATRLGLSYEDLRRINPGLIFCSITPFGESGPYKDRAASELEVQGMSGYLCFLGEHGEAPVRVGADIATTTTGMHALIAILAALFHRRRQGYGQKVEVSMLGVLLTTGTWWIGAHSNPDRWAGHFLTGPYDHTETGYQTKDKPIMFGLVTRTTEQGKKTWIEFAKAIGLEELLSDPYWLEHGSRLVGVGTDAQVMKPVLENAFADKHAEELVTLIDQLGGMAGVFYSYRDLFTEPHPQVEITEMIRELQHPVAGKIKVMGLPWKLSRTPGQIQSPPPTLGQHTEEILSKLRSEKRII